MDLHNDIFSKLCALLFTAMVSANALAGSFRSSDLSRWLEQQPLERLQRLLAEHPRFDGQSLALQRGNDNALTDAVASLVEMTLQSSGNIVRSGRKPGFMKRASLAPSMNSAAATQGPIISCV